MRKLFLFFPATAILFVWMCTPSFSQTTKPGTTTGRTGAAQPSVIKYTPGMTVASLAGRADSDQIQLSNGRRMAVGDARRLQAAAQKIRAARAGSRFPEAFRTKPAGTGIALKTKADLAAALQKPDNTVVQFPSGQRATVGQLKLARPEVEKRIGRRLDTALQQPSGPATPLKTKTDLAAALQKPDNTSVQLSSGRIVTVGEIKARRPDIERRLGRSLETALQQPALTGPVIKVSKNVTKAEWENILKQPDGTVLESPSGKRITVGGLKRVMSAAAKPGQTGPSGAVVPIAAPASTTPATAGGQVAPAGRGKR